MNYSYILSRAWELVWNNKYLWVFGFLAGLTLGDNNSTFGNQFAQGSGWLFQSLSGFFDNGNVASILLFVVALLLWPLGVIARIGLIQEVAALNKKRGKPVAKVLDLFKQAARRLLSILLMQFILWAPLILLGLIALAFGSSLAESSFADFQAGQSIMPDFGAIGAFAALSCVAVFLSIPIAFMDAIAYRAMLLDDLGVKEAIQKAIALLRENLGSILTLLLLCFVLGLVFSLLLGLISSPFLLVIVRAMMAELSQCAGLGTDYVGTMECFQSYANSSTFVLVSLISGVVGAALSAVWVAFQSAVFTVAYQRLTRNRRSHV